MAKAKKVTDPVVKTAEQIKADDELKAEEELNTAFEAGFKDEELHLEKEPIVKKDDEKPIVKKDDEKPIVKEPEIDEWEGVAPALKARFVAMEKDLEKVQNIANTASGRASKLQSQLQKQKEVPPKPTSDEIRAAMTDPTKREALRENFGDFAAAMDEQDDRVSKAVGDAMDKIRTEFRETTTSNQANNSMQRNLDIAHPGWEQTTQKEEFRSWVYEGGPSISERKEYEKLLGYAQNLHGNSPKESALIYAKANKYYAILMDKYPTWAEAKGKMFNDPSGASAIKLLDVYVKNTTIDDKGDGKTAAEIEQEKAEAKAILDKNRQRLVDNVAPTSGKIDEQPLATDQDVEKAFADGFNS